MNHYRISRTNRRGFNFPELLVAVAVLAFGLALLFMNIIQTRKGAQATLEELKGIGYAEDMIERIKCSPYDDVKEMTDSEDDATFTLLEIGEDTEIAKVAEPFRRLTTVEEFEEDFDGTKLKMKKVLVHVTWKIFEHNRENKTVSRDVDVRLRTLLRKLVN